MRFVVLCCLLFAAQRLFLLLCGCFRTQASRVFRSATDKVSKAKYVDSTYVVAYACLAGFGPDSLAEALGWSPLTLQEGMPTVDSAAWTPGLLGAQPHLRAL